MFFFGVLALLYISYTHTTLLNVGSLTSSSDLKAVSLKFPLLFLTIKSLLDKPRGPVSLRRC